MSNRNNQPKIMHSSRGVRPDSVHSAEIARRTLKARSKLYELIVQFRMDATEVSDPKAQLLFEFSAEILAGMARSFREYDENPEGTSHPGA
jgi:hypothetical protein